MVDLTYLPIPADGSPGTFSGDAIPAGSLDLVGLMTSLYSTEGFEPPWIGYFAAEHGSLVGFCAFKSPPRDGRVEIAYSAFAGNEGRGIATTMASYLADIARKQDPDILVVAQTLPGENASTSILRKLGFICIGTVDHPEDGPVWEWHLPARAAIER